MEPTQKENHLITHKTVFYTNDNNDSGGPGALPPLTLTHAHLTRALAAQPKQNADMLGESGEGQLHKKIIIVKFDGEEKGSVRADGDGEGRAFPDLHLVCVCVCV